VAVAYDTHAAGLDQRRDGDDLFAWLRHYGASIALVTIVAASAFAAWTLLRAERIEAWTMVVDRGRELPIRELSVVAETLFRTPFGSGAPADLAELRSVPDARLLFVIGRGTDGGEAVERSQAAASSFVRNLANAGYAGFQVIGTERPTSRSTREDAVLVAVGAALGAALAIAVCAVRSRRRRPVLTYERAARLMRPSRTYVVPGRWSFLGALRGLGIPSRRAARRLREHLGGEARTLLVPGHRRRRGRLERRLKLPQPADGASASRIIAVGPSTPEQIFRSGVPSGSQMIWIT